MNGLCRRFAEVLAPLAMVFAALASPAAHAQPPHDDKDAPAMGTRPGESLPPQDLSPEVLYGYLIAEIALQRGDAGIAAQTFLELARRTRDPRIARRAYGTN